LGNVAQGSRFSLAAFDYTERHKLWWRSMSPDRRS
jgi:hypothetical protein